MNKLMCLLLFSFVLVGTHVRADIIGPPPTSIDVQISNLNEFPDVVIVAYDYGTMPSTKIKYSIVKDKRLTMSHSFGRAASFFVLKKDYLEKIGIENIKWDTDRNVQPLNVIIGSVFFSDIYSAIDVEFKLAKKSNTYYVYKSKITGKPKATGNQQAAADVVKTYTDNVVDPLEPIYVSEKIL